MDRRMWSSISESVLVYEETIDIIQAFEMRRSTCPLNSINSCTKCSLSSWRVQDLQTGVLYQQTVRWSGKELFKNLKLTYYSLIDPRKLRSYLQASNKDVDWSVARTSVAATQDFEKIDKVEYHVGPYDITYHPRKVIQGRTLVNFIAEFIIRMMKWKNGWSKIEVVCRWNL